MEKHAKSAFTRPLARFFLGLAYIFELLGEFFEKNTTSFEYYFFSQATILLTSDSSYRTVGVVVSVIFFLAGFVTTGFPELLYKTYYNKGNSGLFFILLLHLIFPIIIMSSLLILIF